MSILWDASFQFLHQKPNQSSQKQILQIDRRAEGAGREQVSVHTAVGREWIRVCLEKPLVSSCTGVRWQALDLCCSF